VTVLGRITLCNQVLLNANVSMRSSVSNCIVGEDHYNCPWYVAAFFSLKLCRFQASHPSLNTFFVETPDSKHQFCDFLSLARGHSVVVNEVNLAFIVVIARECGNEELFISIESQIQTELNISAVLTRLVKLRDYEFSVNAEIDFIASHLYEFSPNHSSNCEPHC
jgi:hypothetical protein